MSSSQAPSTGLRSKLRRHGAAPLLRKLAARLLRPFYDRRDFVFVELELATWEPRFLRRPRGVEVVEVTRGNFDEYRGLLTDEIDYFEEQFALDSRFFLALRKGELAGILGLKRSHTDPRWRIRLDVDEDAQIVHRIYVAPAHRRGAAGGVLVEAGMARMRDEGLRRIAGVILARNRSSLVLAENLGLRQYEKQRVHRFLGRWQTAPRVVEGAKAAFSGRTSPRAERARTLGG